MTIAETPNVETHTKTEPPAHPQPESSERTSAAEPIAEPETPVNEDKIRNFVRGPYSQVVATVAIWSGSLDDANDAVADALGRAWEKIDRGQTIGNLAAFVTTTAMNRLRTQATRRALFRRKRHLLTAISPTDPTDASIRRLDVQAALAKLTIRQRTMIALHYGSALSVAEIATYLGVAEGTVKATLHQARALLAELLDPTPKGDADDREP